MAEDRTEDAQVKAASVTGSDHGLGVKLVGHANARGQALCLLGSPAHIEAVAAVAGDVHVAICQVQ